MTKFSIYRICRAAFPDQNPDWREPCGHIDKWTDDAVAFEFLRRNAGYWKLVGLLRELDVRDWPLEPVPLYGSKFDLADIGDEAKADLMRRAEEEFGLWRCYDPRLPISRDVLPWTDATSLSSRYATVVRSAAGNYMEYRFGHAPPDTVTIDLRARGPIEPQIEFVHWILNRVRSWMYDLDAPRIQRSLFGEYLRLLDARDDGASLETIAKQVHPRMTRSTAVDRVRKRLKAADGGYRDILLYGKIHIPDWVSRTIDPYAELTVAAEEGDSDRFDELQALLFPPRLHHRGQK